MDNKMLKGWLKRVRLNEATISTVLGGLVVVVVGILIYNYFSQVNKSATEITTPSESPSLALVEENGGMVPEGLPVVHTVAPGEDLWKISDQYYQNGYNWVDIAQENQLANASQIEVGQELTIPRAAVKVVSEAVEVQATPEIEADEYLVQKGDSLWKISVRAYNDGYQWTKVWEANQEIIADPNVIEAGMLLALPR
jgi:nucleoid-associated protein YgaU